MNERSELLTRLICFAAVLLAMAVWEWRAPRRQLTVSKPGRWGSNLSLVVLNILMARALVPLTAVGAAEFAHSRQWGLLTLVPWPAWSEVLLAVLLFDLAIYLQHVLFHAVPLLWRLHMVHHADLDFDVTTGVRFHTLEIILSALIKVGVVFVLGPPVLAVILFEVLLNATSMFNHSNVRMPGWMDRVLRWIIVTPDMHRVHHSVIRRETDSNFGFNLPWWDYLLGTYLAQPREGHEKMTIGLSQLRSAQQTARLLPLLWLPFGKAASAGSHSESVERQAACKAAPAADGPPENFPSE